MRTKTNLLTGVGPVDDEQLRVLLVFVGVLLGFVELDGQDGGSLPVPDLKTERIKRYKLKVEERRKSQLSS